MIANFEGKEIDVQVIIWSWTTWRQGQPRSLVIFRVGLCVLRCCNRRCCCCFIKNCKKRKERREGGLGGWSGVVRGWSGGEGQNKEEAILGDVFSEKNIDDSFTGKAETRLSRNNFQATMNGTRAFN